MKSFGKLSENNSDPPNTRKMNLGQWKEMFKNELVIIKFLFKMGCISKLGGGDEMPEYDSDLEEEILKGE